MTKLITDVLKTANTNTLDLTY